MSYRYLLAGTTISGNVYSAGDSFNTNTSHTVRGFTPNNVVLPITSLDKKYHSLNYFAAIGNASTNLAPNIIQEQWYNTTSSNTSLGPYLDYTPSSILDAANQSTLDTKIQFVDSASYVVADASNNFAYLSGINVSVSGTTLIPVFSDSQKFYPRASTSYSSYTENAVSIFGYGTGYKVVPGTSLYFQMAVWQYPGSSVADINRSNITFIDNANGSVSIAFNGTTLIGNGTTINTSTPLITYPSGTASSGGAITFTTGSTTTGGSGLTARIDAGTVNQFVDLSNLRYVGFNLAGVGSSSNYSFNVSNLKLVTNSYQNYYAGIQTKLGILENEQWPQTTQKVYPAVFQDIYTAYNYTYVMKFNSGHPEGGSVSYGYGLYGDQAYGGSASTLVEPINQFSAYLRINPDRTNYTKDYLQIQVLSTPTQTQILGYDGGTAGTLIFNEVGPAVTNTIDYVTLIHLQNTTVSVEIWSLNGSSLGSILFSTNMYTTNSNTTGYVGYDFSPGRADFTLDYVYAKDIIVAEYTSKTFNSAIPVEGVSIYANTSAPNNIISYQNPYTSVVNFNLESNWLLLDNIGANIQEFYNVQSSYDSQKIPPASLLYSSNPDQNFSTSVAPSIKITKNVATDYLAGTKYYVPFMVNNTRSLSVKGSIYYDGILDNTKQSSQDSSVNNTPGAFRVVLWNKNYTHPIYVAQIPNLIANQWNNFEIDINSDIYTSEIQLEIQHVGTNSAGGSGSFWLNNVQALYRGINWEASNNNGRTWLPFYDNINLPYGGVRFPNDVYRYLVAEDSANIYWRLDETSGTVAYNYSSYGSVNNGTYLGTATISNAASQHSTNVLITDPLSTGIRFAGSSTPGSVYIGSAVGLSTAAVSAEGWFRTGTAINQTIIGQTSTTFGSWSLFTAAGGTVGFGIVGYGTVYGTANYANDVEPSLNTEGTVSWNHIAGVFDGNVLSVYFNGNLLKRNYQTNASFLSSSTAIAIVGPTSGYRYQDETAVYPYALTGQQVLRHYNGGVSSYNQLKIRARAYTLDSWIKNYEVTPHYARLGKLYEK